LNDKTLQLLIDFVKKYLPYKDEETIKGYILLHEKYQTLDYCIDDKGVVGIVRYNIEGDGVNVLDFAVREDKRRTNIGKTFLIRGLRKWQPKYIRYNRYKYDRKNAFKLTELFKFNI